MITLQKPYDYASYLGFELCQTLWPLLETFHAFMIKMMYNPLTYMPTSTLEVEQNHTIHPSLK
jgi:hypothetical protein